VPKNCADGHFEHSAPGALFHEEGMPIGPGGPPLPPKDAGARSGGSVKSYGGQTAGSSRRPAAIGTGTAARPVSAASQNGYKAYYSDGSPQKPSAGAQPALIGPLGYDDLK
jgi:hypothetical protein